MGENAQFLDSFHICILVDDEGKCYSLEHVAECLLAPGFPPTAAGRHISSDSPPPPSGVARRENAYHNRSPGTQIIQMCFLVNAFFRSIILFLPSMNIFNLLKKNVFQ